jgi:hypothetical protein
MDPLKTSDSLSTLLSAWRVQVRRQPDFRSAVWARIAAGADAVPWGDFVRRHAAVVGGALALAIVVGAFSGHGQARRRVAAESAQLAAAYVEGLDARMTPGR